MSFQFLLNHFFIDSGIYRIDIHAAFAEPVGDENAFPLTYTSPNKGEEKKEKKASPTRREEKRQYCFSKGRVKEKEFVPSPIKGEGQDESESPG
ncbi:MAG: hypothetical protein GX432_06220 [Candidatus Atribacteria bacterium]|nr:hypothetical protein [Candidatus Atribacteria bacterium]